MKFNQTLTLKNGKEVIIRNGDEPNGKEVFDVFNITHEETDYLLSYPEENSFTAEQEAQFLKEKALSSNAVELIAIVDGKIAGMAGIEPIGEKYKVRHRADFGISVLKDYWGIGLGKMLASACIQCAKEAGFHQLELQVVAENDRAIALYKSLGFVEYGRNPKGFNSKFTGYQELIYMLLELK